ncbi:MAG TPA: hypothetical protein P5026_10870 [Kiritimatiellia bacterium]|jgi:hypothetical protein|nr:hypothetical protein [Kiritimatiellia bacterium]MDX9793946.1 hypothetical protein [Kiritimatiellia bacterium]HRR34593.1 hypothetical protein [Kiritimatiellia bacterium]
MDIDINAKDSILELDKLLHLTQMIRASLETPNDLMRRALLARGDYSSWDGTTAVLGANRYALGKDAKFFGKKAKEDNIIQAFMKELLLLPLNSLSEFFQTQINDFKPSPIESAWEKARAVLINDPENMSKMGEKLFSITYDETKVYGLTQQKVTSENTSFLLAEVPPQTETQNHESLGEQ